jgi:hypothetical protein
VPFSDRIDMHHNETFIRGYHLNKVEQQDKDWILVGRYVVFALYCCLCSLLLVLRIAVTCHRSYSPMLIRSAFLVMRQKYIV